MIEYEPIPKDQIPTVSAVCQVLQSEQPKIENRHESSARNNATASPSTPSSSELSTSPSLHDITPPIETPPIEIEIKKVGCATFF